MNKSKLKYTAVLLSLIMLASVIAPTAVLGASADKSSVTVVKVIPGVGKIDVNGRMLVSEKPFRSGKILYVPLRTLMEAFGADVIWLDAKSINVLFNNISAELYTGKTTYIDNNEEKILSAPPVTRGKTVMVPSDFISRTFNIAESTNAATGETSFVLENDGSLTDLSFLTGGLNKPGAGNSYFGWSLNVPKGSRITSQTFNSKAVQFENDYLAADIDIFVQLSEDKTLEDYYEEILDDPYSAVKTELIDSRLSDDSKTPFIELLYTDTYDEAIYHRIYAKNGYFYNIIITSFNESNPEILKKDKFAVDLLTSFSLDYKGGNPDISDLSKVSYGLAGFSNYITSESTGKKLASWDMSILPEWDRLQLNNGNAYITEFGTGPKQYVSVETSVAGDKTAEVFGQEIKDAYGLNFNPALFSLKKTGSSEVAGITAYSMLYEAKIGKNRYTYDERVLVSGGLMYDITLKTSSEKYEKDKEGFENMLKTFKPYNKDVDALTEEIEKYRFNSEKTRLGKDDRYVLSENKTFSWSISLPGKWQKNSLPGQNVETFFDPASGGVISVEAVQKKPDSVQKPVEERFSSMAVVSVMDLEPPKIETIQAKGRIVKKYVYRLDDEKSDSYADITYYILEGQDYSYCYMNSISDLTSSESNLKALDNAWESFTIVDKNGEK